jgi:hypothetical protein
MFAKKIVIVGLFLLKVVHALKIVLKVCQMIAFVD